MMSAARAALTTSASRVVPTSRARNLVRAHDSAKRGMPRRPLLLGGVAGVTARLNSGFAANAVEAAPEMEAPVFGTALSPAVAAVASLQVGQKLAGGAFEVLSVEQVPEYSVACAELVHVKTGARWMHCGADDPNNVFNVAFRTTPTDDSGVAHILEHTALCGSEKYPIRDPFFNMLRRSLSTFMNAMTAADYTCYPFATMNSTDYFNLLGVYLDAAFFPKLSYEDFLQEGHRLEFAEKSDSSSELTLKGVVFNEMKGAMGSQSARFSRALSAELFPTSTYHHNSGGDPVSIPNLTHEDLKNFHATHYHPSNARFYTYGDLPLEDTLMKSQELALSRFDKLDVSFLEVADEKRFDKKQARKEVLVPTDAVVPDQNKQTTVSRAYLMVNQIKEPAADLENFALVVASDLLLSGPQAYFHESLLESGLGSGFAPGTGYSSSRRETSFAVGMKGVAADDVPEVEKRIEETIAKITKEGFPRDRVDAVMHQVELGAARVSTNFGLGVAFGAMGTWVHGGDGLRPLRTPQMAAKLQAALDADPKFWQKLFKKRFAENTHEVTVVGVPDADYDAKLEIAEKAKVAAIAKELTQEKKDKIVKEAVELVTSQDSEQDVTVLPTLKVSEAVPRDIKKWNSQIFELKSGSITKPLQIDAQPTNGITYVNVLFDITDLPDRLVPYVDLFADFITELGTKNRNYKDLAQYEKLISGGIGAGVDTRQSLDGKGATEVYLSLSSHALDRNVADTLDLMSEIATSANWLGESERVGLLLSRRAAAAGSSVASNGMQYAKAFATATIAAESQLDYRTAGLPHVAMLQRLAKEKSAGVEEVEQALSEIAAFALNCDKVSRVRVACVPDDAVEAATKGLQKFLQELPVNGEGLSGKTTPTVSDSLSTFTPSPSKAFISVPQQTNYCAAAYKTVSYQHEDSAPLYLLGHALSSAYLHREVREKGGAYGGGAGAMPTEGIFAMSSYRDPNTLNTIQTFSDAAEWASEKGNLTSEILEEAHLKAFKAIDAPLAPSSRGASLFTNAMDDESRQVFRDRLLDCTVEQMRLCAEKYLVGQTPALAIVGAPANADSMRAAGWAILDAEGKEV